jgi:hypothetical protein
MELRKSITVIALRATVRLAGRIEQAAQALGDLGERLLNAAERYAGQRQINIVEVMETMHAEDCARIDKHKRTAA